MLAVLLLAAAAPATAEAAERAFAAMAQRDGQWTAFRAYAAPAAIMFFPEPRNAHDGLAGRNDPASPVMWWPAHTIPACDGSLAVSTGPWLLKGGKAHGSFTTVWQRQPDGGWKWLLDHGRETASALPAAERAAPRRPACAGATTATAATRAAVPLPAPADDDLAGFVRSAGDAATIVQREGADPERGGARLPRAGFARRIAGGASADQTLRWESFAVANGKPGAHDLRVYQWNGRGWRLALYDLTLDP